MSISSWRTPSQYGDRALAKHRSQQAFAAWRLAVIGEGVASRHLEYHPEDAEALRASQTGVARLMQFAAECLGAGG